jgi:hypothetical protein
MHGQLHMTTHRLIWTPALKSGVDAFFPSGLPILVDRSDSVRVAEDDSGQFPFWMPLKWRVETSFGEYVFSFGVFSGGKRMKWLEAIRQWTHQ